MLKKSAKSGFGMKLILFLGLFVFFPSPNNGQDDTGTKTTPEPSTAGPITTTTEHPGIAKLLCMVCDENAKTDAECKVDQSCPAVEGPSSNWTRCLHTFNVTQKFFDESKEESLKGPIARNNVCPDNLKDQLNTCGINSGKKRSVESNLVEERKNDTTVHFCLCNCIHVRSPYCGQFTERSDCPTTTSTTPATRTANNTVAGMFRPNKFVLGSTLAAVFKTIFYFE